MEIVLVPLIYVLGNPSGSKVDCIDDDIERHSTERLCAITFSDKYRKVQKSSEVEDSELRAHLDVPEIHFGNIHLRNDLFQRYQGFTFHNRIAVRMKLLGMTLKVIFHCSDIYFKKGGDLLLQQDDFPLVGNAGHTCGLFNLPQCEGVVEYVLPISP